MWHVTKQILNDNATSGLTKIKKVIDNREESQVTRPLQNLEI